MATRGHPIAASAADKGLFLGLGIVSLVESPHHGSHCLRENANLFQFERPILLSCAAPFLRALFYSGVFSCQIRPRGNDNFYSVEYNTKDWSALSLFVLGKKNICWNRMFCFLWKIVIVNKSIELE